MESLSPSCYIISICNLNRQEALPPCRPFNAPWQQRCAAKLHWASRTGRSISWLAKEHTPAKEVSLKSTTAQQNQASGAAPGNWATGENIIFLGSTQEIGLGLMNFELIGADRRWSAMLSSRIYRIYDHPDLQHPRWWVHDCCRSHWSAPRQRIRHLSASPGNTESHGKRIEG